MRGDGDSWVETPIGPRWGRYGAAGLLLYSVNNVGEIVILLQHRATWVAQDHDLPHIIHGIQQ